MGNLVVCPTSLDPVRPSDLIAAGLSTTESASSAFEGDKGEKTADNIRYGQNISESGMGGMTNSTGTANQEGGYGGTGKDSTTESNAGRTSQRYGPGNDVGA